MAILSDDIEQFIKQMMDEYEGMLELKRNELAEHFSCAPSQINYVLSTRFNPEHGYVTESRRGGGGYIRLVRVNLDPDEYAAELINDRLSAGKISERSAHSLIKALLETGFMNEHEARLMFSACCDKALKSVEDKDTARCSILRYMMVEQQRSRQ